jgi:hypothetical protein
MVVTMEIDGRNLIWKAAEADSTAVRSRLFCKVVNQWDYIFYRRTELRRFRLNFLLATFKIQCLSERILVYQWS